MDMTRKVFISFLGTGPDDDGYSELDYTMKGKSGAISTEFVQRAEIEFLGKESFDEIFILCTEEAYKNFHYLRDELASDLKVNTDIIQHISIEKVRNIESAWRLFDKINSLINEWDCLTFDFTNGFRSLSIILSTALNFILKSKEHIHLEHVFYGERSDDNQNKGRIIDMKDFYVINEWADGVNRLVETADASKLASLVKSDANAHFRRLNDQKLINALQILTDTLKNIDINRIARRTENALKIIDEYLAESSGAEKELLELVKKKFQPLLRKCTGEYDKDYFLLQIKIMQMLLQHKLYMQAFTVAREFVGSIGMLGAPKGYTEDMHNNGAADDRPHYADLFVSMIEITDSKFFVTDKKKERSEQLKKTITKEITDIGLIDEFKTSVKNILPVRNGFDHAWTGKGDKAIKKIGDFKKTADEAVNFFDKFVALLIEGGIIQ